MNTLPSKQSHNLSAPVNDPQTASLVHSTSERAVSSTSTDLDKKQPTLIKIVETVQNLKEVYRPITQEERDLIARWPGWGPYAPAFESHPTDKWKTIAPQLRVLLGAEGYDAACAATPTSFFTSPYISKAIWRLAELFGFSGGAVLEPGCGTGQVLSYAPPSFDLQFTGVEQEPFTASIAQLLFPQAHIINAPLQEVALLNDAFDLVVGNVPFADVPIYDRTLPFKEKLSLHNYFIYRALSALRPGGIAILVTSRYTMDAISTKTREILSQLGILLGAIRLPSYGHKWAKTAVITDILVFQRKYPNASWDGHHWNAIADLSIDGIQISTNTYFVKHPQQILGTVSLGRGMYHDNELLIKAPEDLEGALEGAIQSITVEATGKKSTYIPRIDRTQLNAQLVSMRGDGLKEGCYYLLDKVGLVEITNGQPKAVTKIVAEISDLVRLRDTALALLESERDYNKTDEALIPLRTELNRRYDAYVEKYGYIRRSTLTRRIDKETGEEKITRRLPSSMYLFRTDEHYPLLLGLETYNDEAQKAQKAAIFFHRVNHPAVYKEMADSREEAIALSLDQYGSVNFTFIAKATGMHEEEIANYLGALVYEDPQDHTWEIAPNYLSGNVRKKLEIAQKALQSDSKWQRNVNALLNVQPEPIAPEDIKVLLGAPWIPVNYIIQFCYETLKMKPAIVRDRVSGAWDVAPPQGVKFSVEATSTWGTRRVSGFRLIEHLLNHKTTTVEDEGLDGKTRINTEETMLAQHKRKELQTRFGEWIWEDNTRTKELSALYNKLYNGIVASNFNGDHLSFPSMDAFWQKHLYPWQRDFIARMINNRSALCAYPVGAGKTKIQVAGAMTLRRMKLISKAAILVPNHLLEQIASEAKQLYPSANVLMISRDDLARENRRIFMARIATGDHDLVVMTHSAFEAVDVHPDTKKAYIQERIKEYKQVLYSIDRHSSNKADQRRIKRLEKQLQRMREHLKELLGTPHDAGITFEQLGISYLIVDEAHFFKNLGLPTNQEKLSVTSSQRAQDMLMKLRWLEKQNGTRPFASFFTATPISNSMVEAYVMLWYLNHEMLKEYELFNVDDFASMFIETEAKIEVTPNGAGFRMYERPSNFINLPEFMHLFASVADIRSPDILADKRPDLLEHTISVEPTPEVEDYVNSLVERSDKLRRGDPISINGKIDNMLWVTGDGRKAALWMGLHGIKEEYPAKLDAIATEMARVYHRWQEKASYLPGPYKSLQIGFCDMGTPNKDKGDQVYGEIKRLLVQKGVPASGIRFIHEVSESDSAKALLFEKCRAGEVAILLGSTAKLGTGTNIQTRCAAIHHCDATWRPDEIEQRIGRGQRPGNLYPVVEVFYYVQQRTFDAYSWQILSNKAKFFNQMRSSTVISRELAYSDDSSLTYGQVKAAATGDILLLEHANVSLSADAFSRLHASFKRARERDKQEASALRDKVGRHEYYLQRYRQIQQQIASYKGEYPFMTPSRLLLKKKEEQRDFIANEVLSAIKKSATAQRIGYWQGVPIFFKVNTLSTNPYVFAFYDPYRGIDVPCSPQWVEQDNQWRFAWKIEQFLHDLSTNIEELTEIINNKRKRAEEFELQAKTIFPHQQPWQTAISRKQVLDAYIDFAARTKTKEDHNKLAKMRQQLLDTAPKEMTERPKPKHTATSVLLPRNPNAEVRNIIPLEMGETKTQDLTTKAEPRPVPVTVPAVVGVVPIREEKTKASVKAVPAVQSKSALVFGNAEHILLARKRRSKQAPIVAVTTPQEVKPKAEPTSKPVKAPAVVEVVPLSIVREEKAETAAKAVPTQPKSTATLVFGNAEHILLSRKRNSQKEAPVIAAALPQEVKSKAEPRPAPITAPTVVEVMPVREEKTEAGAKAVPVQSKPTLVFGNAEHILLSRSGRKKDKARAKPAVKKRVYAEFLGCECCGGRTEETPIGLKATPGQPHTLWDLIESPSCLAWEAGKPPYPPLFCVTLN
jgi:N12 class adenine-specific DNA methylase